MLMLIPSIDEMAAIDVTQEAPPCIILAKMENAKTVKVASVAMCSLIQQLALVKPTLLLRLLWLRIVERYMTGLQFDAVEPLEDHDGEPFII